MPDSREEGAIPNANAIQREVPSRLAMSPLRVVIGQRPQMRCKRFPVCRPGASRAALFDKDHQYPALWKLPLFW